MSRITIKYLSILLGFVLTLAPKSIQACTVCFGNPNSPMVHGAKAGVVFLAAMVYVVVMAMGSVAVFWILRARKLQAQQQNPTGEPDNQTPPN